MQNIDHAEFKLTLNTLVVKCVCVCHYQIQSDVRCYSVLNLIENIDACQDLRRRK